MGNVWNQHLAIQNVDPLNVNVYPNPTSGRAFIKGLQSHATIDLYSVNGQNLNIYPIVGDSEIDLNLPNGIYTVVINSEGKLKIQKLVVNKE